MRHRYQAVLADDCQNTVLEDDAALVHGHDVGAAQLSGDDMDYFSMCLHVWSRFIYAVGAWPWCRAWCL